jgi:phosphatidate cytidylyltransferase
MLRQRVITAVILLALLGAAGAWSASALLALCALLAAIGMYEWLRLAGFGTAGSAAAAATYAGALIWTSLFESRLPEVTQAVVALMACAVWCGLAVAVAVADRGRATIGRAWSTLLAAGLLSAGWLALVGLLQRGVQWLVSVLAVVWIADIAAYFTGRALGRHKLAPRISPGKTWEGVWGAAIGVALVAVAVHYAWPASPIWSNRVLSELAWPTALGSLLAVVALSIVGDLFESLLKRQAGVKDSGWVLPGHGGVLDRIDATLPTLPAAVLIDWWTR